MRDDGESSAFLDFTIDVHRGAEDSSRLPERNYRGGFSLQSNYSLKIPIQKSFRKQPSSQQSSPELSQAVLRHNKGFPVD